MLLRLKAVLFAGCVALCGAPAAAQVTLSPAEMRELAAQAVVQGQSGLAYDLSGALVARDDQDLNAHLIRSRAARNLGRNEDALFHARAAWDLADDPDSRYAAALATAQALSSSGQRTAAQFWLRRAVQLAPNDALKERAAQDFQYVRRQNRWSNALSFSISPSSNINNGSRNATSQLFDLPLEFELEGEARALSGIEIFAGIATRYRLIENDLKHTNLRFAASHRTYRLSDEAKDIAPDAEGSDFATTSVSVAIQETYWLPQSTAQLGWSLRLGEVWYGGDELLQYNRVGATYQRGLGTRGLLNAIVTREDQNGLNGRDDAVIWTGRLGYGRVLENGDRLTLSTTFSEADSDASFLDYTQREVAVRYSMADMVGPARLIFGLSVGDQNFDRSDFSADGRQERSYEATITAAFPDIDYYGFIPAVTLRAERTDANIDIYETENIGVQVGILSAF